MAKNYGSGIRSGASTGIKALDSAIKMPKLGGPLGMKRGSTAVQPPAAPTSVFQDETSGGIPGVKMIPGGAAPTGSGMTSPMAPAVAKTTPELAKQSLRNKLATAIPTDATKMQDMLGKTSKPGMTAGQVNGIPQDQWRAIMQKFGVFDG